MKSLENNSGSIKKKRFSILLLFLFIIVSQQILAQVNPENESQDKQNKPDVKIKVNKELDNEGNVIRYDSTYTWSWSSDSGLPVPQEFCNDTMKSDFFNPFENNFDSFGFSEDSLFEQPFNSPDIDFIQKQMLEMMRQQQKMMEEFFGQPPALPVPEENKNNEQNKTPAKKTAGSVDI